ncbi:OmpA family protein (plasmid) [Burkholderia aenigmatica]|uniref:OmpA family protein n=1 Tax=Burkholderia aenigmatica TaxID=2015348 RepID=UPI003B43ADAF
MSRLSWSTGIHGLAAAVALMLMAGCVHEPPSSRPVYAARRGDFQVMSVPVVSDIAVVQETPRFFVWKGAAVSNAPMQFSWEVPQPDLAGIMQSALPPHEAETASSTVYFHFDSAQLDARAQARLNVLPVDASRIDVDGYTDSVGAERYNRTLSERRANTVKHYLMTRGVPGERINARGHGAAGAVASNRTAVGRAKNRRAEVTEVMQ